MHIDKIDDIISKESNTYHNTIKMKPVDVMSLTADSLTLIKKIMKKILYLKQVIMSEYQNIKAFLQGYIPN